jgi:hypothetical protein
LRASPHLGSTTVAWHAEEIGGPHGRQIVVHFAVFNRSVRVSPRTSQGWLVPRQDRTITACGDASEICPSSSSSGGRQSNLPPPSTARVEDKCEPAPRSLVQTASLGPARRRRKSVHQICTTRAGLDGHPPLPTAPGSLVSTRIVYTRPRRMPVRRRNRPLKIRCRESGVRVRVPSPALILFMFWRYSVQSRYKSRDVGVLNTY